MVLLIHINKYSLMVHYSYIHQLFADTIPQMSGRDEKHLNLFVLYTDKGNRSIGVENDVKMPDICQSSYHIRFQFLNILFP